MNASLAPRRFGLAAVLVAALASAASANDVLVGGPEFVAPAMPTYVPGFGHQPMGHIAPGFGNQAVPLLGFQGIDTPWGLAVETVSLGSTAQRIGLESGDVIVGLNGQQIRNYADYRRALAQSGGMVQLLVRDVRTGSLVWMQPVNLFQPPMNGGACVPVAGY